MKVGTDSKLKFKKLKMRLRLALWEATGLLESIWAFASRDAQDGDIGKFSNEEIALSIEWERDPDDLIDAMVACGWFDKDPEFRLIIHDWSQHVPNWLKGNHKKHGKEFADVIARRRGATKERPREPRKERPRDVAKEHPRETRCEAAQGSEDAATIPSHVIPSQNQVKSSQVKTASGADAGPSKDEAEEFVEAWNGTRLTGCRKLTDARRRLLGTRLKNADWRASWREALRMADASPFCRGVNDRGWKADIEWFLRPDTTTKIMEGKYDANGSTGVASGSSHQPGRVQSAGNRQEPEIVDSFDDDDDDPDVPF